MNQSNIDQNHTNSPYFKLASWLDLCISEEDYQVTVSLSCSKCLSRHDLSLDLYGRPYKVVTNYTALTSPFAHIGEEIRGDVVIVNVSNEPNQIVFWFDIVSNKPNIDKNRKQLNSTNILWVEVDPDDIDLQREENIGVIWTEPLVRLIAFDQSKTYGKIVSDQCENNPNQTFTIY